MSSVNALRPGPFAGPSSKAWLLLPFAFAASLLLGYGVIGLAEELSDEQIRRQLDTNVTAPIQLVRAVTPHLREQGGGRILQTSSMGGHIAYAAMSLYHTTKWAIEGFFEAYALEVEPFGRLPVWARAQLEAEAERLADFLDGELELSLLRGRGQGRR